MDTKDNRTRKNERPAEYNDSANYTYENNRTDDHHGDCCRGRRNLARILIILLAFLAGMGFHALISDSFHCPLKKNYHPHPVANVAPMPSYTDGQGGNIIIINTTDGDAEFDKYLGGYNKMKGHKKHHHKYDCDKDYDKKKFKNDIEVRPLPAPNAPIAPTNDQPVKVKY